MLCVISSLEPGPIINGDSFSPNEPPSFAGLLTDYITVLVHSSCVSFCCVEAFSKLSWISGGDGLTAAVAILSFLVVVVMWSGVMVVYFVLSWKRHARTLPGCACGGRVLHRCCCCWCFFAVSSRRGTHGTWSRYLSRSPRTRTMSTFNCTASCPAGRWESVMTWQRWQTMTS